MHIHARNIEEQSAVQQSQVSQSTLSLNSSLECDFGCHCERHCSNKAGQSSHLECRCDHRASPSSHFDRDCDHGVATGATLELRPQSTPKWHYGEPLWPLIKPEGLLWTQLWLRSMPERPFRAPSGCDAVNSCVFEWHSWYDAPKVRLSLRSPKENFA